MSHKGVNKAMNEINKRHHTQHTTRAGIAQTETAGHITGRSWGKTPRNSVINDRNF